MKQNRQDKVSLFLRFLHCLCALHSKERSELKTFFHVSMLTILYTVTVNAKTQFGVGVK